MMAGTAFVFAQSQPHSEALRLARERAATGRYEMAS